MEKISENNRRNIVFCFLHNIYEGICSNIFALGLKFSDFVPKASSVLRNFPTFLALDFPQLSDVLRKRVKFHINLWKVLKRVLNGLLDLSLYWVTITSIFLSSNTGLLSKMGRFLSLRMEIQNSEGKMKSVQCWDKNTFSFPIGKR